MTGNTAHGGRSTKRGREGRRGASPENTTAKHVKHSRGLSVKEMETNFPKKTLRYAVFKVLQKHGQDGMSADEVIGKGEVMGFPQMKPGDVSCKRQVAKILCNDPNFARIKLGVYSLSCYQSTQQPVSGGERGGSDRSKLARQITSLASRRDKMRDEISMKEEELVRVTNELEKDEEAMMNENCIPLAEAMLVDPSDLKQFDLSEEDKAFKGDDNDRKSMLEHRQRVQMKAKELDKARDAYIKEYQDGVVRQRKDLAARVKHQKKIRDALNTELQDLRMKISEIDGMIASAEDKKSKCPPKLVVPIEDERIVHHKPLFEPVWFDAETAARFAKMLAISDNLILIGTRNLGVKAPAFHELKDMLESATANAAAGISSSLCPERLHQLYSSLLELIIYDEMENAVKGSRRWSEALSEGSWPEILRRFILLRDSDKASIYERPDTHASLAASMLAYNPVEDLTYDQHVALLHYLTDNVLVDSMCFRDALQKRENAALHAKRDARDEIAEEKKRLREIQEAKKRLLEHADTNEGLITDTLSDELELPDEYTAFKGNPETQKKEYEALMKSQESMKRKLEKERIKKFADKVRAERAEAARLKKLDEDREHIVKEIESAEKALELARQAYQDKVEKLKIRRDPVGFDRHYRRYWYGVGGSKAGIFIEDPDGKLACVQTEKDLECLMSSLDTRGVREKNLFTELNHIKDSVIQGMRRANKQSEPDDAPSKEGPLRQSSRQSRQVEFFDPSRKQEPSSKRERPRKASPQAIRDQLSILPLSSSVNIAYSDIIFNLTEIKRDAIEANIPGPPGDESWEMWTRDTTTFGHEYGSKEYKSTTSNTIMRILQEKSFEVESILNIKSQILQGKRQEESEPESSDQSSAPSHAQQSEFDSVPLTSPSKFTDTTAFASTKNPRESKFLWHTMRERMAWMTDLKSSATPARLAFNISILRLQCQPMFRFMANQESQ